MKTTQLVIPNDRGDSAPPWQMKVTDYEQRLSCNWQSTALHTEGAFKINKGFTLIELVITVTVAGVLAAIAIPNFSAVIASSQLSTNANELITSLNLAKSEAVKRGQQVTMARQGTTAGVWEGGWIIFVDADSSNAFNDDGDATLCEINSDGSPSEDCLLKNIPALNNGITVRTGGSTYQNYAAYMPSGLSKVSVGDTFRICGRSANTVNSRAITISASGRARASNGAASCP